MKKLFFVIVSIQMLFGIEVIELQKGDTVEGSVKRLEKKYYKVGIHNLKDIRVKLTELNEDVDLYVRTESLNDAKNNVPIEKKVADIRRNDCYSSNSNTEDEECRYRVVGPAPGTYDATVYIMVYGFKSSSYKLEVTQEDREKIDELTTDITKGRVKKGETVQYKIYGEVGETVKVSLFDLTADADLRLKIGKKANKHNFDCKSNNGGTKVDSCSVTLDRDAWVYVQVDGYRSADYSIKRDNHQNSDIVSYAEGICLEGKSSTDSNIDVVCNDMHDGNPEIFTLVKDKAELLMIYKGAILKKISVEKGTKTPKLYGNNDHETSTVVYFNGSSYDFYAFRSDFKKVLSVPLEVNTEVSRIYIAQKNSDFYQIILEYSDGNKSYRDDYLSRDYFATYTLDSHKEIILDKAAYVKDVCLNNKGTSRVACLQDEYNVAYLIDSKKENVLEKRVRPFHTLYVIKRTNSSWKIWNKMAVDDTPDRGMMSIFGVKKLDNTALVYLEGNRAKEKSNVTYRYHDFYMADITADGKITKRLSFYRNDMLVWGRIKTIDNGTKLYVKYKKEADDINDELRFNVYDLTTNPLKLIESGRIKK